jgi:hypothetical protein
MAKFLTSIELPQAEWQDYTKLKTAMGKALFKAVNSSSISGRLEFHYDGADTIVEVIGAVTRVVKDIGKNYSFTVIKDKNFRQHPRLEQHN